MSKNQSHSLSEDIRKLELELIDVETRLNNTGLLERSYPSLAERRDILLKQLDHLKQQTTAVATRKTSGTKVMSQSAIVKQKVAELQNADPNRSLEDILDEVAEGEGKTTEAVKASYYRKPKKKP